MPQQRISFDPDPPVKGKELTICYDFNKAGIVSTSLVVTYRPDDMSGGTHEVSVSNPCVTITVPDNATHIQVVDSDGTSPDRVAPVVTGS